MPEPTARETYRRLRALGFTMHVENGQLLINGPRHQMMPTLHVAISRNARGISLLAQGIDCATVHNKPELWTRTPDRARRDGWYSAHCPICDRFMGSGPENA